MSIESSQFLLVFYSYRSHVCWHVYGLLHRSDRNYNEAIKAYKQALRIDPINQQIMRDLSMLQIQMRDLDGFEATRNSLLTLKPNAKINWMAVAVAKHLAGDLRGAVKVIDVYLGTLTEESEELGRCFESSELALYKNRILAEIPENYKEALDHLQVCETVVVDRGSWLLYKAEYLLKLRDFVGAKQVVMAMLDRGMTENYRVHSIYMCVILEADNGVCDEVLKLKGTCTLASLIPLSKEQRQLIRGVYENELQPKYPKSYATTHIPITLIEGEELKSAIDNLCRRHLSRGVPSLCNELLSLLWIERNGRLVRPTDCIDICAHPQFQMYVGLVDGYIASLLSCSKFSVNDETEEPPSTLLWVWYLRAGLHELASEYTDAITMIDNCIDHTPTAVDLYELKARILMKAGDIIAAVECIDKGRELDQQDRYINNETTRYMLLAGLEEQALNTIALFAKHEGNPEQNLFEMQCSWYELELAVCLRRKQEYGRSLKKYGTLKLSLGTIVTGFSISSHHILFSFCDLAAVLKHFEEIHEDQFDFHSYCLRKTTLRSYMDVLRFEDGLFGEDYYVSAAIGISRIYLHLYDNPLSDETGEPDYATMSAAERKKAKAIARKKKKAIEKEEAELSETNDTDEKKTSGKNGKPSFVNIDPLGKELLAKNPLEEAATHSATLARYVPKNIDAWILRYDVAIRRGKTLMALQALHKARSLDPENSDLFTRTVDFCSKMDSFKDISEPARVVLKETVPLLIGGKTLSEYIQTTTKLVLADATTDLLKRCAVAKALVQMQIGSVSDACSLITMKGIQSRGVSVKTCQNALMVLQSFGPEAAQATKEWAASVKTRFPLLSIFDNAITY